MQIDNIEGVLVDAGQVLVTVDEMAGARKLSELTGINAKNIADAFTDGTKYREYESGHIHADAFLQSIIQMLVNLDSHAPTITLREAESAFAEWITGEVEGMDAFIRGIRTKVRKCIASNTNPIHWSRVVEKAPVVNLFQNDAVFSYMVRVRKPHELFFREALRHLGVPARRALLVDDNKDNCAAFRRMGGYAIQFDCREQDARWLTNIASAYQLF